MFTTEASYTVPISIAVVLLIISLSLYLHDIVLMDTSVKEAALMWESSDADEDDIKEYLSRRDGKIYVISKTDFEVDIDDSDIEIVYSGKGNLFYSIIYLLLGSNNRSIEFRAYAKKLDLADNLRRVSYYFTMGEVDV